MFFFLLNQAWRGLWKKPGTTLICLIAIALGVGAASSTTTLQHTFSNDPFTHNSSRLFNVRIDTWQADREFFDVAPGEPPKHNTYRDVHAMMEQGHPTRQTAVANAVGYAFPPESNQKPYKAMIQLVHHDFFSMFEVPFAAGSAWDADADAKAKPLVVLSQPANQKLFGGENSVGKSLKLGGLEYTICGVMAAYNPFPKAYDMVNNPYSEIHDFFIPFDLIRNPESQLESTGDTDAFGPDETFQGDNLYTVAEYYWIQFWVELSSEQVPEYTQFLEHYAQSQKEAGRHPRPINNRVTPLRDWLSERGRVNQATAVLVVLSLLFLIVCALNLTGLLMAKFMSRSQVLGIQRALGATRGQVFLLHLLECELLAIFGGLLGLGVSYLAMGALRGMAGRFISGTVFSPDWFTFLSALFFSLFVGVLAGFYPSWRACRVAPAIQIKL